VDTGQHPTAGMSVSGDEPSSVCPSVS